ncbi:MAG: hypothetical protein M1541_13805 [Acidobacteria bacterium]|nr:hypothetical protein [Acidobacteriota bacterium]
MKTAAILFISMAAVSCAQEKKPDSNNNNNKAPQSTDKRRLESVTWDLKSHKLVWVVQRGSDQNGKFVANKSDRYEISPDDAVMSYLNEKRGFTQQEASSLYKLLDTLSLYCAESVVWWDQGEGVPLDGKPIPKKKATPSEGGQRVEQKPKTPANPSLLVAELQ